MTVVSLSDYMREPRLSGLWSITFFGPKFCRRDGTETSLTFTVNVDNGDVLGVLTVVQEQGGIVQECDDQIVFLPWPCAAVAIHAPDSEPLEIREHHDIDISDRGSNPS